MKQHKRIVWLAICASLLFEVPRSHADNTLGTSEGDRSVVLRWGTLRITNRVVELRCDVVNNSDQDIWVYDKTPNDHDLNGVRGTNASVYMSEDWRTLIILRRINLPHHGIRMGPVYAAYARLRARQSRPYVLFVALPVVMQSFALQGFDEAIHRGIEDVTRLALEIGYYAEEDLRSLQSTPGLSGSIRFESADRVLIYGEDHTRLPSAERSVRSTLDNICIPYRQWLQYEKAVVSPEPPMSLLMSLSLAFGKNMQILPASEYRYARDLLQFDPNLFNEPARQIAGLYVQLAEGRLAPGELIQRLDSILGKADRERLIDELYRKKALASAPEPPRLTLQQALQDLFYDFSVDLEQYRYAEQLLHIDKDLYDDSAERIADVYVQVAEGRLNPSDLMQRLDKILSRTDRDRLLQSLQEKQATRNHEGAH